MSFGTKAGEDGAWQPGHFKRTGKRIVNQENLIGTLHVVTVVDTKPDMVKAFNKIDTLMRGQDETLNERPSVRDTPQWAYLNLAKLFNLMPILGNSGNNLKAMIAEIKQFGNTHAQSAFDGESPRPIEKASFWKEV